MQTVFQKTTQFRGGRNIDLGNQYPSLRALLALSQNDIYNIFTELGFGYLRNKVFSFQKRVFETFTNEFMLKDSLEFSKAKCEGGNK